MKKLAPKLRLIAALFVLLSLAAMSMSRSADAVVVVSPYGCACV